MKVTAKHLQFLAQKKYPSLYTQVSNNSKVSIHELIPADKKLQPYGRERECEVLNTLTLLCSWRRRTRGYEIEKMLELSRANYNLLSPNNWRLRLFKKLLREHRKWKSPII